MRVSVRPFRLGKLFVQWGIGLLGSGPILSGKGESHEVFIYGRPVVSFAPVAKLDIAPVYGTGDCRFESCRAY